MHFGHPKLLEKFTPMEDVSDEFKDEYNETKASTVVRQGGIAVVNTRNYFPYYFVRLRAQSVSLKHSSAILVLHQNSKRMIRTISSSLMT